MRDIYSMYTTPNHSNLNIHVIKFSALFDHWLLSFTDKANCSADRKLYIW